MSLARALTTAGAITGTGSVFARSPGVLGIMIPLAIPLLSTGMVNVTAVVIALAIYATVVDASPFSAVGALVLANCPEPDREQMFRVLFWRGWRWPSLHHSRPGYS